jgi:cell division protein FtsL
MSDPLAKNVNSSVLLRHQKVRRRVKKRQKTTLSFFILIIVFTCTLIFFVWSRLQITNLGYQISQADNEQQQLIKLNKQMKVEAASLKSLSRIERIAKNQLRLTNPEPNQVVFIK